jgi:hypothetical protein
MGVECRRYLEVLSYNTERGSSSVKLRMTYYRLKPGEWMLTLTI